MDRVKNPAERRGIGLCAAIVLGKCAAGVPIARAQRNARLDLVRVGAYFEGRCLHYLHEASTLHGDGLPLIARCQGQAPQSREARGRCGRQPWCSRIRRRRQGQWRVISFPLQGVIVRGTVYHSIPLYRATGAVNEAKALKIGVAFDGASRLVAPIKSPRQGKPQLRRRAGTWYVRHPPSKHFGGSC